MIAYAGKTTISFSPFKISIQRPYECIGLLLLGVSLGCFRYQSQQDGFKKGFEKSIEVMKKSLKEERP